jgi:hypothetical protein
MCLSSVNTHEAVCLYHTESCIKLYSRVIMNRTVYKSLELLKQELGLY